MELTVIGQEPGQANGGGCSSSGCGSNSDQMSHLPEHIRQKVQDHPCYSEEAHHHFARMHVAVAPACNIQCHYCNRKYDCSNESRPGVVSELLTPDQAVRKVMAVAANIPQMTVLGIAGPGDPLANPERTFDTFRQLSEKAPDIKLCVSTNGLTLPQPLAEQPPAAAGAGAGAVAESDRSSASSAITRPLQEWVRHPRRGAGKACRARSKARACLVGVIEATV